MKIKLKQSMHVAKTPVDTSFKNEGDELVVGQDIMTEAAEVLIKEGLAEVVECKPSDQKETKVVTDFEKQGPMVPKAKKKV